MSDNVKVTRIGNGVNYAKVADRELAFREKFPNGKITTEISRDDNDRTVAKAWIWKDKTEMVNLIQISAQTGSEISPAVLRETADANGTADFIKANEKQTEKLETTAIGRALAHLGFAQSGEIASSEEMELFDDWREQQFREKCDEAIERLSNAKSMEELAETWTITANL